MKTRTLSILAGCALLAASPACAPRGTRILDRPDLARAAAALPGDASLPLWTERSGPPAEGHYFVAASGDFNGDGRPDLVGGRFEPGGVAVWLALPDGRWKAHFVPLPSSEVRDLEVLDLDADGADEILAVSRGGIEGILRIKAPQEGPWPAPEVVSNAVGYEALVSGDFNEDGRLDLAAARQGSDEDGGVEVWLADDRGGLRKAQAPVVGSVFRDVDAADLDGDGHLDLVAAGWGLSEGVRVLLGDGKGRFLAGPVLGSGGYFRGIRAVDVTGDGVPDIVTTSYRRGVRVFASPLQTVEACVLQPEGSFWKPFVYDADGNGAPEVYAPSTNGLGIPAWVHVKGCEFRRTRSGLPEQDVWYGLRLGVLRRGGSPRLLAAGYQGGIRTFTPLRAGEVEDLHAELAGEGAQAEDVHAHGNEAFTTVLGFAEYRLGPHDVVRIRLFNGSDVEETEATVQSDGQIFVPSRGVGSVPAAGLSPTQLKRAILDRAQRVWREPDVEVVVLQYRSHKVSLLGEIRSTARVDSGPGQYPLEGMTRVVDFISRHGGPTERADLNRVQLIRPDGRSSYLNLFKAIFASDQRENPILNEGDTVFVPSVSLSNRKVFVLGEVRQPGLMELRENITLLEAVARAEGFTRDAVLRRVLVIRGGLEQPELIAVDVKKMLEQGDLASDLVLKNGDVVYVPRRFIADVKDAFAAIQPALNLIEDIFIIRELSQGD